MQISITPYSPRNPHVVIRKILEHLGLWDVPKRQSKHGRAQPLEYANSQVVKCEEAYYEPE